MSFDAAIFDLDGTLVDSAPDVRSAVNRMLAARNRRALDLDEVRRGMGMGTRALIDDALAASGGPVADTDAALADYLVAYAARPVVETTIHAGVETALLRLLERGVRLGVCTNKPENLTRMVLEGLGLARLFAAVAGGDTLPYHKPDGRHVTGTLDLMGGAARPVYVGDSETDFAAARAAGIPIILVSFGYSRGDIRTLGADRVIDHYDDLDAALAELAG
jgi:phosphoglycolate phosphatase